MSLRNELTSLFLPLLGQEFYIEIISSISGKVYVPSAEKITFNDDASGNLESVDIEYGSSIFVIWTEDIEGILDNDFEFMNGEEYDEDFKFYIGISFVNGMEIYIYKNNNYED